MIEQQGSVVGLDGPRALVRIGPVSGCPACEKGQGCGAGVFGRLLQRRPIVLSLANGLGARPGNTVRVAIPEGVFLRLAARFYLVPVLAALAGAAAGHHLGIESGASNGIVDMAAAAGALAGLLAALPRRSASRGHAHATVRLTDVITAGCARAGTDFGIGIDKR